MFEGVLNAEILLYMWKGRSYLREVNLIEVILKEN